jgi:hypothetical protein
MGLVSWSSEGLPLISEDDQGHTAQRDLGGEENDGAKQPLAPEGVFRPCHRSAPSNISAKIGGSS